MTETDPLNPEGFHPWLAELGAYVVGALEPDEAQALRRHLGTCPVCQAEFAQLDAAAGLLATVPAESFEAVAAAEPDPAMWERLRSRAGLAQAPSPGTAAAAPAPQSTYTPAAAAPVAHARRRPRSRLRWPARAGASAALSGALVALASTGVVVGLYASSGTESAPSQTVSAVNSSDGVSGTVQYHSTEWGSWVQVTLKGVPAGDNCVMYAIDGHGNRSVAGSWWAPYSGSQSATIPGGVAMNASDIRQFVVETTNGQILLTVPVT